MIPLSSTMTLLRFKFYENTLAQCSSKMFDILGLVGQDMLNNSDLFHVI